MLCGVWCVWRVARGARCMVRLAQREVRVVWCVASGARCAERQACGVACGAWRMAGGVRRACGASVGPPLTAEPGFLPECSCRKHSPPRWRRRWRLRHRRRRRLRRHCPRRRLRRRTLCIATATHFQGFSNSAPFLPAMASLLDDFMQMD